MIALEHVVHAIRRDGERDAQKLEQTADELLSREENIATRIIGTWRAFRPRSKGTQKIVILQIHFDSNSYQAAKSATTNLSEVKKRIGWPIINEAIVVPPSVKRVRNIYQTDR